MIVYFLIAGIILLIILIILLIMFFNEIIFDVLTTFCDNAKGFISERRDFFAIFFLGLFFFEQLLLVFFTSEIFPFEIGILRLIIGIFALIVITTASLQKIILESKITYYKEKDIFKTIKLKQITNEMERRFEEKN